MALLTTEDVLNKKFQYVKFREGYDQVEVDEFLDEVVSTIYTLNVENQDLKEKLEAAERRIAELSSGAEIVEAPLAPAVEAVEEAPAPVDQTVEEAPVAAVVDTPAETVAPVDAESAAFATNMLTLAQRVHDEYVRDGKEESERIIAEAHAKGDEIVADAQNQHVLALRAPSTSCVPSSRITARRSVDTSRPCSPRSTRTPIRTDLFIRSDLHIG